MWKKGWRPNHWRPRCQGDLSDHPHYHENHHHYNRLELTPGSRASPVEATGSTAEELLLPGFVQTINKVE